MAIVVRAPSFPNGNASQQEPRLPSLSIAEERALLTHVAGLPPISVFTPSSCHDRAHAIWMLMPIDLQPKLAKVWVLSESAYTSLFHGGLTLTGVSMAPWRYHVALVYRNSTNEVMTLDPAIGAWPGATPLSQWVNHLRSTPDSVLPSIEVLIDPQWYLFYGHPYSAIANNRGALNTGEFFEYQCQSSDQDFIPRSLARDDVAADASSNKCLPLKPYMKDATALQAVLDCAKENSHPTCTSAAAEQQGAGTALIKQCTDVVDLYRKRFDFWKLTLPVVPNGAKCN